MDRVIQETRSLTFEVSCPLLYRVGLEAAIDALCEELEDEHGLRITFEDDGEPKDLADDTKALLYRGVRELLVNVIKHAGASSVQISARRVGEGIRLIVQDDGSGFDAPQVLQGAQVDRGFGLFNLKERLDFVGGSLEIDSAPERGTRVVLHAPLLGAGKSEVS